MRYHLISMFKNEGKITKVRNLTFKEVEADIKTFGSLIDHNVPSFFNNGAKTMEHKLTLNQVLIVLSLLLLSWVIIPVTKAKDWNEVIQYLSRR